MNYVLEIYVLDTSLDFYQDSPLPNKYIELLTKFILSRAKTFRNLAQRFPVKKFLQKLPDSQIISKKPIFCYIHQRYCGAQNTLLGGVHQGNVLGPFLLYNDSNLH